VRNAYLFCRSFLEGCHRLTKNELLGVQHTTDSFQEFLLQWAVLAFEVQHGHRLSGFRRRAAGRQCFLHLLILSADMVAGYPQAMRRIQRRAKQERHAARKWAGESTTAKGVPVGFALLSSDGSAGWKWPEHLCIRGVQGLRLQGSLMRERSYGSRSGVEKVGKWL
jgi:hypothetical protein